MFFALSAVGERTHIDDASAEAECYCPICDASLIQRRGAVRHPHFAHKPGRACSETWKVDMSEWHFDWQMRFPKNAQEIVIEYNGQKHRADVMIDGTVIEFQNSPISMRDFDERNSFYTSAGYRVIWLFNLADKFEDGRIKPYCESEEKYVWKWHSTTFDAFDCKREDVRLYFQFGEACSESNDKAIIKKVTWVSPFGFRFFAAHPWLSAHDFIELFTGKLEKCKTRETQDEPVPSGKTIPELWQMVPRIRVGRFVNRRTHYEVQITRSPVEMSSKYRGRIYGRIKKPGGDYYPNSAEIYNWNRPEWLLRWYAANE